MITREQISQKVLSCEKFAEILVSACVLVFDITSYLTRIFERRLVSGESELGPTDGDEM